MAKVKTEKQDKQKGMRENIMEQAFNLMAQYGVKDISMRQIADACGITKPVIYYYFKDKDDLCYRLIKERLEDYNASIIALINKKASLEDIMCHIFSSYAQDFGAVGAASKFVLHLYSYIYAQNNVSQELLSLKECNIDKLRGIINKEVKQGKLTKSSAAMLEHLIIAVVSHLLLNNNDKRFKFGPSYPRDAARALLKAVSYKQKRGDSVP